jgi:translation initiation factor IF-3
MVKRKSAPTAAALRKAQDMGLDLVLIAPLRSPVAKAIDYGHYQYEQKKEAARS